MRYLESGHRFLKRTGVRAGDTGRHRGVAGRPASQAPGFRGVVGKPVHFPQGFRDTQRRRAAPSLFAHAIISHRARKSNIPVRRPEPVHDGWRTGAKRE